MEYTVGMDLVFLPGNSVRNKEWIAEVAKVLEGFFDSSKILSYKHWEDSEQLIDFDVEMERLGELTKGMKDYAIFAKSAGVLLALRAISEGIVLPKKCIFVGSAIGMGERMGCDFDSWLRNYSVPTLWIQKSEDPAYHCDRLDEFLKGYGVEKSKLVELSGDDHAYLEVEELRSHIEAFVK